MTITTLERTVFDEITDFLASEPSVQELMEYQFSDDLQARLSELIERNGEGLLNADELRELDDFIRADDMVSLLKIKTQLRLKGSSR